MRWQHCAEILLFAIFILCVVSAFVASASAVVRAYRAAAMLRKPAPTEASPDVSKFTDEYKAQLAQYWKDIREKATRYYSDLNISANPLRRDALEIIKESGQWARLGIQYALIGNGAALAALPYLLSQLTNYSIPIGDALWSAAWFAGGAGASALCCLIAYADHQVMAGVYWSDLEMDFALAKQRHFEVVGSVNIEPHLTLRNHLKTVSVVTSLSGAALGVLSWIALGTGAIRLIASLAP